MLILYAENDADDAQLFDEVVALINPDITCIILKNGEEVLDYLKRAAFLPGFIFLDINMPVMDGLTCLRKLKYDRQYSTIPVIMYSTNCVTKREYYSTFGAIQCIDKPFSVEQALTELRPVLSLETNSHHSSEL